MNDLRFFMEKGYCRSGRALQFIDNARVSTNTGFKVAHYISAFESLFSTNFAELSHKLSERVAFFLGSHGHSKKEVFQNIKVAYGIRSKLVHGDNLSKSKIQKCPEESQVCDLIRERNHATHFWKPKDEGQNRCFSRRPRHFFLMT